MPKEHLYPLDECSYRQCVTKKNPGKSAVNQPQGDKAELPAASR
jgi:hypothetical protein